MTITDIALNVLDWSDRIQTILPPIGGLFFSMLGHIKKTSTNVPTCNEQAPKLNLSPWQAISHLTSLGISGGSSAKYIPPPKWLSPQATSTDHVYCRAHPSKLVQELVVSLLLVSSETFLNITTITIHVSSARLLITQATMVFLGI